MLTVTPRDQLQKMTNLRNHPSHEGDAKRCAKKKRGWADLGIFVTGDRHYPPATKTRSQDSARCQPPAPLQELMAIAAELVWSACPAPSGRVNSVSRPFSPCSGKTGCPDPEAMCRRARFCDFESTKAVSPRY